MKRCWATFTKYVEKPTHNPFTSLGAGPGRQADPAPLRPISRSSEGCSHRCTFCIIPSHARGSGEPPHRRGAEAKRLKEAGVKEILVISQDTSAYGVDVKHRTGFYDGMPVKTSMVALCEELSSSACGCACTTSTPTRVDDVIP